MKKISFIFLFIACVAAYFFISQPRESTTIDGYMTLANEMGIHGDHIAAGNAFKMVLEIDPYHVPAYLGLGTAYGNSGRIKEAINVFKEGIKINPSHQTVPQMQISIASLAHNMMNDDITAIRYAKMALELYTTQGDYEGVALVGKKLREFDSGS